MDYDVTVFVSELQTLHSCIVTFSSRYFCVIQKFCCLLSSPFTNKPKVVV